MTMKRDWTGFASFVNAISLELPRLGSPIRVERDC